MTMIRVILHLLLHFLVLQNSDSDIITSLPERELLDYLDSRAWHDEPLQLEKVGVELVRRESAEGRIQIQSEFDRLASIISDESGPGTAQNYLTLLSLLRMFDKESLPLEVSVQHTGDRTVSRFCPPEVSVFVKNVDAEKSDVFLLVGGEFDYTGRNKRVDIRPISNAVHLKKQPVLVSNSSRVAIVRLPFDQQLSYELDLQSYLELGEDGTHEVEFVFDPWTSIDAGDLRQQMIRFSKVFKIETAVPSPLFHDDEQKLRDAAQAIPSTGPIVLLESKYGDWAHHYVSPESPCGELLQAGIAAAPVVFERYKESQDPFVRAWCLVILNNLTNHHHPEIYDGQKLLGNYIQIYKGGSWTIGLPNGEFFHIGSEGRRRYCWYGDWFDRDPRLVQHNDEWSRFRVESKRMQYEKDGELEPDHKVQSDLIRIWQSEIDKILAK